EFGGAVTVSLPYTPEPSVRSGDYDLLTVYSVNGGGSLQEIKGARFNPATGAMLFATTHFSRFVVSEWISPFTDTAKEDWFYRAVRYSRSNGLISGTGENTFSPKTNLTRAMLVTILAREAGAVTSAGDTWYSGSVDWGVANGITDGANMTDDITREEFAVILCRYAKLRGRDVSQTADLAGYADAGEVSGWAVEAVGWANATGLLSGRTETTLVPGGAATRAEAAAILQRFIESGA
ncbi:MAG: S-layer homology domain-containing protein, partial [Peptococcaceae bacterium]|nr:S-layer homology domain-containing protein [Peptococcaceae bacterium]